MSKYVPFEGDFKQIPSSIDNMRQALIRLGKFAPDRVIRKAFGRNYKKVKIDELPEPMLFKLGILYVRLSLNKHLGKSGKYKNKLIIRVAQAKIRTTSDGNVHIICMVPKKEYFRITSCIYNLLHAMDCDFLTSLMDIYNEDVKIKNPVLKAVIPIHTNIVLRSIPQNNSGKFLKRYIKSIEHSTILYQRSDCHEFSQ